jgi:hypothetical protein
MALRRERSAAMAAIRTLSTMFKRGIPASFWTSKFQR